MRIHSRTFACILAVLFALPSFTAAALASSLPPREASISTYRNNLSRLRVSHPRSAEEQQTSAELSPAQPPYARRSTDFQQQLTKPRAEETVRETANATAKENSEAITKTPAAAVEKAPRTVRAVGKAVRPSPYAAIEAARSPNSRFRGTNPLLSRVEIARATEQFSQRLLSMKVKVQQMPQRLRQARSHATVHLKRSLAPIANLSPDSLQDRFDAVAPIEKMRWAIAHLLEKIAKVAQNYAERLRQS